MFRHDDVPTHVQMPEQPHSVAAMQRRSEVESGRKPEVHPASSTVIGVVPAAAVPRAVVLFVVADEGKDRAREARPRTSLRSSFSTGELVRSHRNQRVRSNTKARK